MNKINTLETLSAQANVYARRALRALEAGDIDACATYAALELQTRAALGEYDANLEGLVSQN